MQIGSKNWKNISWVIVFIIEIICLFLILCNNIPFLLQIETTGYGTLKDNDMVINTFIYVFIILLLYLYVKNKYHIKLSFSCKFKYGSFLLKNVFEFLGRTFLMIMASIFVIIYIKHWNYFWNFAEFFSLIYIPSILFSCFLIFKEFEELSKRFI